MKLSKRFVVLLILILVVCLGIFWMGMKLSKPTLTQFESPNTVASRPMFRETYPTTSTWYGEYACTKTNIYVTNAAGVKERIFTDKDYEGDELELFVLSPDRMHAIAQFTNQTCGGKDTEYSYYEYVDLFNGKTSPLAGKKNTILAFSSNILFSPDSKNIAYFNNNAIYLFDTTTGKTKKLSEEFTVEPAGAFATNQAAGESEISHSPFVTFVWDTRVEKNPWIYQPRRNLTWKDNQTLYFYTDLFHDLQGFYSLDINTGAINKLSSFTYEDYQALRKQNSKHQMGTIEYPIENPDDYDRYQEQYCKTGKYYSLCQI